MFGLPAAGPALKALFGPKGALPLWKATCVLIVFLLSPYVLAAAAYIAISELIKQNKSRFLSLPLAGAPLEILFGKTSREAPTWKKILSALATFVLLPYLLVAALYISVSSAFLAQKPTPPDAAGVRVPPAGFASEREAARPISPMQRGRAPTAPPPVGPAAAQPAQPVQPANPGV